MRRFMLRLIPVALALQACVEDPMGPDDASSSSRVSRDFSFSLQVQNALGDVCTAGTELHLSIGTYSRGSGYGPTKCTAANGNILIDDRAWNRSVDNISYASNATSFDLELYLSWGWISGTGRSLECALTTNADVLNAKEISGEAVCTYKPCWECSYADPNFRGTWHAIRT